MSKKKSGSAGGIVYSTNPDYKLAGEERASHETITPAQQKMKVRLDTKQRGGKVVTLITGYVGKESDLEDLGKQIKTFCGTGGAVKNGEIIIQGDQRDKVIAWLIKNEYKLTKKV
jgi:translation initiation factor 1